MPGRLEILRFLRESSQDMRGLAMTHPSKISADMLRIADEIAADAIKLEAELIEAGLLPRPANLN
jgi:hypothetical protein